MNQSDISLLIIDDEPIAVKNLAHVFKKAGYAITTRQSGPGGLRAIEERPFDIVLTDLRMEEVDGMEILHRCRELHPDSAVIVITGYATLSSAVTALREGAFHYIAKPFRLDEVREVVRGAVEMVRLRHENRNLRRQVDSYQGQVKFITQDQAVLRVLETAHQIADSGCSVLVTGESGTGKELLARYLHAHSPRVEAPFVAVNCGAFQEELLANELFGHEKGAFTGADTVKRGLIETAEGGTLLLDEIAEMTPSMQVKLLRVIQERELLRLGGVRPIKTDVRYIAATNRDLEAAVAEGSFRQDLYYRLNVVRLQLPALAHRSGDVPLLAYHFLKKHAAIAEKSVRDITPEAMTLLTGYGYPGNIRELENAIEFGVAMTNGDELRADHLPGNLRETHAAFFRTPSAPPLTLEEREAQYIRLVLEKTVGNRTQAARILGIDRVSLWRKIKRHGINADES
ncbi:sigma-54-dependent transcriptional regulator [Thiohalomonas denitrificans]|uniref:sigma-54-dependent transcriptional regulator n=1 Tax=Thiohalomonas denitrificans TaxID=415747 RepID=UPI0026ECC002|nr:sigma-54 dependent transcriptional regulator [Thiohalomonas denitrificans]